MLELNLQNGAKINGGSTFNKDLYGATGRYTVTFTQTGNGSGNLITGDIKLNNTSGNQSHIAGVTLGTSIQASELNCEIAEKVEEPEEESICKLASDSTVAERLEGAKYNCKVDPNKPEYTFYLIDNNEDGTSDLIMNANINASGEAVIPGVTSDTGTVAWYADEGNNINGPVTAMTYLYNATKSWTNVEPVNYTYNDREVQGITTTDKGYQSFVSTNGIATITKGDETGTQVTIGNESEPLRARMPIKSSDANVTEVTSKTNSSYLYDNFDTVNYEYAPYGYWTLSSDADYSDFAWIVDSHEGVSNDYVASADYGGVRPVITVKL